MMDGISLSCSPQRKKFRKNIEISRCIICYVDTSSKKLFGTENGHIKLRDASNTLNDRLCKGLDPATLSNFVYHMQCYQPYTLNASRKANHDCHDIDSQSDDNDDDDAEEVSIKAQCKRNIKSTTKCCVICNNIKSKSVQRWLILVSNLLLVNLKIV